MSVKLRTPEQLTILESVAAPTFETNSVKLFAQDDGGTSELFVIDSTGAESQITAGGTSVAGALLSTTGVVVVSGAAAPSVGQVLTALGAVSADWQTPGGTPSGLAGGDLGGTYPNPTVEALGTTGASVNVGLAAPPSTNQILKATSPTTATWQTEGPPTTHATSHQNAGGDEISVAGLSGQLADGQRASALVTSGADVVVSAASPPSTGQVLMATGATAASWQTPSAGGSDVPTNFTWAANAATLNLGSLAITQNFTATNKLAGNSVLTLSNGVDGSNGMIWVRQDAGTVRTMSFTIAGRTVLMDLNVPNTNPLNVLSSVTAYQYVFHTTDSVAYVTLNKIFLG